MYGQYDRIQYDMRRLWHENNPRTAIEAQLLGCRTVVVEGRTGFTRNNVLKLWKFLIEVVSRLFDFYIDQIDAGLEAAGGEETLREVLLREHQPHLH